MYVYANGDEFPETDTNQYNRFHVDEYSNANQHPHAYGDVHIYPNAD